MADRTFKTFGGGVRGPSEWTPELQAEMKRFERAVIDIALSQGVNPLVGLYALIRCARVLLRKGDRESQQLILPTVIAYLQGKAAPPGEHPFLWMPPGSEN